MKRVNTVEYVEDLLRKIRDLKHENESLRADAERYRWTGISGNWVSCHLGKWRAHIEERTVTDWHDSRDDAIDAAISSTENPS